MNELSIANGWQTAEEVSYFHCANRGVTDLAGLDLLPNLRQVDISGNDIFDIYALSAHQGLTHLNLSGNTRLRLDPTLRHVLEQNTALTHLGLGGIPVDNIFSLPLTDPFTREPYKLVELDLSNTGLKDLHGIEQFSMLEVVDLSDNRIRDIVPLAYLDPARLRELNLSANRIDDLTILNIYTGLTALEVSDNAGLVLDQVLPLIAQNSGLTRLGLGGIAIGDLNRLPLHNPATGAPYALSSLRLDHTGISDIFRLADFPGLRELDLNGNKISDLTPLGGLTDLTRLMLSDNTGITLPQIQPLIANNTGLAGLGLSGIEINDFNLLPLNDPITGAPYALVELELAHTGISNLLPLSAFTTLRHLDLSANGIIESNDLYTLTALERITLADNRLKFLSGIDLMPRLREIDVSNNDLLDIFSITYHQSLTRLNLSGNSGLRLSSHLLDVLRNNSGLTHLGLGGIPIDNIYSLPLTDPFTREPYKLVELDLGNTGLKDISGIDQFSTLEVVDLSGNQLSDILPLAYPTDPATLRELNLSANRITDLSALNIYTGLTALDVSDNASAVLDQVLPLIAQNTGLTQLGLGGIAIDDLSRLPLHNRATGAPYALSALRLDHTGISDIFRLADFPSLRELDLSGNKINDLTPLGGLTGLTRLMLSDNTGITLAQVQPLIANNTRLTQLGLSGIEINDFNLLPLTSPLTGAPYALIELDLARSGISDIQPLSAFTTLKRLDLSANGILDAYALFTLNELETLNLADNRLEFMPPVDVMPRLKEIDVSYNDIFDIHPLNTHQGLTHLNLSGNTRLRLGPPLLDVLRYNTRLTHLGLGGIPIDYIYSLPLIDPFTGTPYKLVELDLSNTGLMDTISTQQFPTLEVVNLSGNRISDLSQLAYPTDSTTLHELDLSGNLITDPAALNNYTGLTALDVSDNAGITLDQILPIIAGNPGLTRLGLGGIAIDDLNRLPLHNSVTGAPYALTSLRLHGTGIGDITRLADFPALRELDLGGNTISDLAPIAGLTGLTRLMLSDNASLTLAQVQPLIANNIGLTQLGLNGIAINDLNLLGLMNPLTGAPYAVVELELARTGISDLQPLGVFSMLKRLDLSGNGIIDMGALTALTGLQALRLADNRIEFLADIGMMRRLTQIDLANNDLLDIAALSFYDGLRKLNLSGNTRLRLDYTLLDVLSRNRGLTHLGLGGIPIDDFVSLPLTDAYEPYKLVELDLSHTGIKNINGIEYFKLDTLKLNGNALTDIGVIANASYALTNSLRVLELAGNKFTDLSPLAVLGNIEVLNLADNIFTDIAALSQLRTIKLLDLSGNTQILCPDLNGLESYFGPGVVIRPATCNYPPQANAGVATTAECTGLYGASVVLDGSASSDANSTPGTNDDIVLFQWFADYGTASQQALGMGMKLTAAFALGTHQVTLIVTDSQGATSRADTQVTTVDTTPPELSVSLSPAVLLPADEDEDDDWVNVTATVVASDACGGAGVILKSLTSNDPEWVPGTVDESIVGADIGTADFNFRLEAEREDPGEERVYTIVYEAVDEQGNKVDVTTLATIPAEEEEEEEED